MTGTLPAVAFLTICGTAGAVVVETQDLGTVEKYGVLGLLYIVLLAIGVFILKIGSSMVTAIQQNTSAVQGLTTEIKLLVQQHDDQAQRDREQIEVNTRQVMDAIRDVREIQRGKGNGGT